MDYLSWNNAIASSFFRPQVAGRPVYLYVTHQLVVEIAHLHGTEGSEFIEAVKHGPGWITDGRLSLCGKAYRLFKDWKCSPQTRDQKYPPFIAYLALFSLAAGVEGHFAAHAYYPRLNSLLGEHPESGPPAVFDRMWELWLALEDWSKVEMDGSLGNFNFNISGGWEHVGLPIGQMLLSEDERNALPELFRDRALDPDSPPSEAAMLALLRECGHSYLHRRTRSLLASGADANSVSALVRAVIAELEHWDGTTEVQDGLQGQRRYSSTLRLCCRIDPAAATAAFRLRCKASVDYPEAGLRLTHPDIGSLLCEEEALGWSTELQSDATGSLYDASQLGWSCRIEFIDKNHSWHAISPALNVRVFESGNSLGFPGFVETTRLTRNSEFLIAACEHFQQIASWGNESCSHFREVRVLSGLPEGWSLYHGKHADKDDSIKQLIPQLALPSEVRLTLRSGIRTQDGNTSRYFAFAPPDIFLESPSASAELWCNGVQLQATDLDRTHFAVPPNVSLDSPVRLEVRRSASVEARATITLTDAVFPRWQEQKVRFDSLGRRSENADGILGALVDHPTASRFNFGAAVPPIPTSKLFLIGRIPGQITAWPAAAPPDWQPVWAISADHRNACVVPCMEDPGDAAPINRRFGPRRDIKKWKEIVWHKRKRVTPPREARFRELWRRYMEVARDV